MKTTIYDLLGMIKDGKAPEKILYKKQEYEYDEDEKDYANEIFNEYLFDSHVITDILNDEVEILETTITYKQDNIENNKQEPMFKKINGEWYANKDLVEWLDKNYEPIKFKNIYGIYIEKKNKIEKISQEDIEAYMSYGGQLCSNKINEIIDRLNNE